MEFDSTGLLESNSCSTFVLHACTRGRVIVLANRCDSRKTGLISKKLALPLLLSENEQLGMATEQYSVALLEERSRQVSLVSTTRGPRRPLTRAPRPEKII